MELDLIRLDGSVPALRPCRRCGGDMGRIVPPAGPHNNGVRCVTCERHLGWLPKPPEEIDLIED